MNTISNGPEASNNPLREIKNYLTAKYDFRYNVLLSRVEIRKKGEVVYRALDDYEQNSIVNDMTERNIKCNIARLDQLFKSNFTPKYHPFRAYYESLPVWDGRVDYIRQLADTVPVHDPDFWKFCLKKWLTAMVAAATTDEIINHTVIVLSGAQGAGKSTWFRQLIPVELKEYTYNGTLNTSNKDNAVLLQECILINLDEFDDIRKNSAALKDLITKGSTKIRRAYARNNETIIQHASFVASTNEQQFLSDPSGSRRFLCFYIVDRIQPHTVNIDMVHAQAYALFKQQFQYWFDDAESKQVENNNKAFYVSSEIEDAIVQVFSPCEHGDDNVLFMTATAVLQCLKEKKKLIGTVSAVDIGRALVKLKFTRTKRAGIVGYMLKQHNL